MDLALRSALPSLVRSVLVLASLAVAQHAQIVVGNPTAIPKGAPTRPPGGPRLFIVDDTPGCRFSGSIQAAVDAAAPGDIVSIRNGSYLGGIVVDGKAIHLVGRSNALGWQVEVSGGLVIRNLPPGEPMVVRGLDFRPETDARVTVADNAAPVWVEHVRSELAVDTSTVGIFDGMSYAFQAGGSAEVFGSDFIGEWGGHGWASCSALFSCYSYNPYEYDCDVGLLATRGGTGARVLSSARLFLFGSSAWGGQGGDGDDAGICCYFDCFTGPERGGDGLSLAAGTSATLVDSTLSGGPGGALGTWTAFPGMPLTGGGTATTLPGEVGGYTIASPIESGASTTLTFTGPPGWNVFLSYALEFTPTFDAQRSGYDVLPPDAPLVFVGAMPLSGSLQVSIPYQLPSGAQAGILYTQAKLYDLVTGTPYLAQPSALLVYRDPCP
jgi:hypothetical protein